MNGPEHAQAAEVEIDAAGRQEVRDEAAALRAESRQARRHAAEVSGESNAILDSVVLMVTDFLRRQGFALLGPAVARWRMGENGSTGVAVAVRLREPGHADAAKAALVERFPDRLLEVTVS
jgi:hypothetical protein